MEGNINKEIYYTEYIWLEIKYYLCGENGFDYIKKGGMFHITLYLIEDEM